MSLEKRLIEYAQGSPSPLAWRVGASLAEGVYQTLVKVRNILYERNFLPTRRLPGKVISVGNLVAGGTGKSPVVMALAELLLRQGHRPAILTRGYGSSLARDDALALLRGQLLMVPKIQTSLPDEATMQSHLLPEVPVIAGASRFAAATRFLNEHPDLTPTHWLLDDGFQHRKLARDIDIVLLDGKSPLGNGRLLPRGVLREPLSSLRRANLVLATWRGDGLNELSWASLVTTTLSEIRQKTNYAGAIVSVQLVTGVPVLRSCTDEPARAFNSAQHEPALLVTGIAQPQGFIRALQEGQKIRLSGTIIVPDHAPIDREALRKESGHAQAIITTAKDYWRDPEVFDSLPLPTFVAPLSVVWDENAIANLMLESSPTAIGRVRIS